MKLKVSYNQARLIWAIAENKIKSPNMLFWAFQNSYFGLFDFMLGFDPY